MKLNLWITGTRKKIRHELLSDRDLQDGRLGERRKKIFEQDRQSEREGERAMKLSRRLGETRAENSRVYNMYSSCRLRTFKR